MSEDTLQQIARIFRYDGLNRLKKQNVYFYNNYTYNNTLSYNEQYTYDKNGNILTLQRYRNNEQKIDELKYNYYANTNQLSYITDNVNSTVADYDIDTQQPNNYRYDRAGNLIVDRSEKIALRWTYYGKLKQMYYVEPFIISGQTLYLPFTKLSFSYDALGDRLTKSYYQKNLFSSTLKYTDIYVRDIQGNVIANYQIRNDSLYLTELPIYGAERLGVLRTNKFLKKKQITGSNLLDLSDFLQQLDAEEVQPIRPYRRLYELIDWLGNVRVVISDRKYPVSYNPLRYVADVRVVNDYYTFGMNILERSYRKINYRYEFNSQEVLGEQNGDMYSYAYREYDSRVGRFLSVDPENRKYLMFTSYVFSINNPIRFIDIFGLGPGDRVKAARQFIEKGYTKYSQGLDNQGRKYRTTFTQEALKVQDCSELVTRVLLADGVIKSMNIGEYGYYTASSTSIGVLLFNEEIFIKSDKPAVGDIAFWEGHIGIVSEEDPKTGKFKLIHAANPKSGVLENPYFTTAENYRKSKFYGFFRPKNETEDNKEIDITKAPEEGLPNVNLDQTSYLKSGQKKEGGNENF